MDKARAAPDTSAPIGGVAHVFGVIILVCLVFVALQPSVERIVSHWSSDGYRHAWIVPLIGIWLLWQRRGEFGRHAWTGEAIGLVALALTLWAWLVARSIAFDAAEQLLLILIAYLVVFSVAGRGAARNASFGIFFLVFALPLGGTFIPQLMTITADIVVAGLNKLGTPAYREGMILWLPNGTFEVEDSCSGLNYLSSGLALGVLVGHLCFRSMVKQVLYAVAVVVTLLLMNGIRALVVVVVANATHMRVLVGDDHIAFGWALFAATIFGLFCLAHRWADADWEDRARV